ncbi:Importin-11 [Chelonia mydas]|uniref:Importin-11 n=1 Tax=Chelonia mydas TaxID=8469 RepID=M7BVY1_CHEMY|nr:Importin-11 [Chelonia mydas]
MHRSPLVDPPVVENVLKVNPALGPQMFQPLLPSVFRGIIEGEVEEKSGGGSDMAPDAVQGKRKSHPPQPSRD